jgi:hypothetical protein
VFLFRPRPHSDSHAPGSSADLASQALPPLPAPSVQPRSAAEWVFGGLLIRLFNRGHGLSPELSEQPPKE